MSARYAPLPDVNYVPSTERLLMNASTSNKQAGTIKGSLDINETTVNWFQSQLIMEYEAQESLYQEALKRGIPKELARIILPVGRYSKMRAQANLRNWVAFLTLRLHPDAQFEIRSYAKAVLEILSSKFPRVISLFNQVQHTS
jgi:thymidylate synthase (FAD)